MIQIKAYVRQNADGAFRVGRLDLSLDSVVIAFQQGHSPEGIQEMYPALTLDEVYGAIAFYLANEGEVKEYLKRQDKLWEQLRRESLTNPSPVVARLRALKQAQNPSSQ